MGILPEAQIKLRPAWTAFLEGESSSDKVFGLPLCRPLPQPPPPRQAWALEDFLTLAPRRARRSSRTAARGRCSTSRPARAALRTARCRDSPAEKNASPQKLSCRPPSTGLLSAAARLLAGSPRAHRSAHLDVQASGTCLHLPQAWLTVLVACSTGK